MKNVEKNKKAKQPYLKTKSKANGGVEVEIRTSPTNTLLGKIFAIVLAAITVFGGLFGLIYLLIQLYK